MRLCVQALRGSARDGTTHVRNPRELPNVSTMWEIHSLEVDTVTSLLYNVDAVFIKEH